MDSNDIRELRADELDAVVGGSFQYAALNPQPLPPRLSFGSLFPNLPGLGPVPLPPSPC